MTRSLVLASESPYRRVLLDRLGLAYQAEAHKCDERSVPRLGSLEQHAQALATAKASSLAEKFPDAYILGSDQIAEVDGRVLHKPGSTERACEQLKDLAGRSHRLLTAISLRAPDGRTRNALDVHTMRMRALSNDDIARYVAIDSPLDCCGSYKIECLGISLFDAIDGEDFTAIMGMPLIAVCGVLRAEGFPLP